MSKKIKVLSLALSMIMLFSACSTTTSSTTASTSTPATTTTTTTTTEATTTEAAVEESTPRETTYITIGTASVGGTNYPVGMALAQIWNAEVDGAKAVAIATAGASQNLEMLRTNDIEAAVCRAIEAGNAIAGAEPYVEEMPWVRAITGGLYYDCTQIVARNDVGIETIYDFAGKRVAVGTPGSGGEIDARDTLYAHGMDYDDIDPQYIEAAQAVEMMEDKLIDAAILGLAMGSSSVAELMMSGDVIILPIDDVALEKLQEVSPYMERRTLPADVYPNQSYTVETVGSPPDNIICRAEMDEQLVYEMTKAIYENLEIMQASASVMSMFDETLIAAEEDMMLPYHDGTRRYFEEMGWL